MPPSSDGTFHASEHGLTVTVGVLPGDERRAQICLAGNIDMQQFALLSDTVGWLTALATAHVLSRPRRCQLRLERWAGPGRRLVL